MNKLSTGALGKVALGLALAGSGGLYFTRWAIQNKIRDSVSYKEAMQCFRSNPNAVELLGEPISEKSVDIGDNNCYGQKDNLCWVTVPLQGKKRNGSLRYWVTITDPQLKKFRVSRVELEIQGSRHNILLKNEPAETQAVEAA